MFVSHIGVSLPSPSLKINKVSLKNCSADTHVDCDSRTMNNRLFYPNTHVALQKHLKSRSYKCRNRSCGNKERTLVANPVTHYVTNYKG